MYFKDRRADVSSSDQQAQAHAKPWPAQTDDKLVVCKGDSDWSSEEDKDEAAFHETVQAQLGYGKDGASNARFSWWITLVCAAACIGGYAAWVALVMSARDTTNDALAAYGVTISAWSQATAILIALAVLYPILVTLALGVSAWRWALARKLDIHRPDAKWMTQSRRFQVTNAIANSLLWVLVAWLVVGGGTMWAWAVVGQTATSGSQLALTYIDPVWSGLTNILNTTTGVVTTVTDLANNLPAVGRKRMLLAADVLGVDRSVVLAALEHGPQALDFDPTLPEAPATATVAAGSSIKPVAASAPATAGATATSSDAAPAAGTAAGSSTAALDGTEVRAVRKLQQLNGLLQGIGDFVQNVQTSGLGNAASSAVSAAQNLTRAAAPVIGNLTNAAAPLLSALPQILPNGSSNPLFNAIDNVVATVNGQTENGTGCPIYCFNVANSGWIVGNPCICNLDRLRQGVGPASQVASKVMGAFAALMVMYAGCTWLLMHGASQWTRARTEAKLMSRIPGAHAMQSVVVANAAHEAAAAAATSAAAERMAAPATSGRRSGGPAMV